MSKLLEDVVLSTAIVLGLLIGLYLSYAVVKGQEYPPTLITFFLAIGISALIYRFMGGFGQTTFQAGLLRLGGTAAFFAGMIVFVGDRLRDEIGLYSSTDQYRTTIANLQQERDQARSLLRNQSGSQPKNCPLSECTISEVKKMQPEDPFVQGIKKLVEGEDPPFSPILRELPVKVAVVSGLGDLPSFSICQDVLDKLNEGVAAPDPSVQFSRTPPDGAKVSIEAKRAGRIGIDVCSANPRTFDVQINCSVALKLFADKVSTCSQTAGLRGETVSIGSLAD